MPEEEREAIKARIAELEKANAEAPGWGAAVGARYAEIKGLKARLAYADRLSTPPSVSARETAGNLVNESQRRDRFHSDDEAAAWLKDAIASAIEEQIREKDREKIAEINVGQIFKRERDLERRRAQDAEARLDKAVKALKMLHHAVCGDTGFAEAVRLDSGLRYPWPALDEADTAVRAALSEIETKQAAE